MERGGKMTKSLASSNHFGWNNEPNLIKTSTEDDSFNLWVQLECNQNANIIKSPFICEELDQMERRFGIFDIDGNGYIF